MVDEGLVMTGVRMNTLSSSRNARPRDRARTSSSNSLTISAVRHLLPQQGHQPQRTA